MVAYKIFSFLAIAVASVVAAPSAGAPPSSVSAQQCGNGQVVSCCNAAPSSGDKNVLPLGLSCLQVPAAAAIGGDFCPNGNTASCCQSDQDGLININLSCTPLGGLI